MTKDLNTQKGFTLIELAVVILIAAVMTVGVAAVFKPYMQYSQMSSTDKKMTVISDAFALFAQNYGRLPCPAVNNSTAQPFGSPVNSGSSGTDIAKNPCGTNVGIVPFRALGLTEDEVRDGYSNYFTYAVNSSMTQYSADPSDTPSTDVDTDCTSPTWLDSGKNKNLVKAHVCCPRIIGTPIEVRDGLNSTTSSYTQNSPRVSPTGGTSGTTTPVDDGLGSMPGPWVWYKNRGSAPDDYSGEYEYKEDTCSPPPTCLDPGPVTPGSYSEMGNTPVVECILPQPPQWINPYTGEQCQYRRLKTSNAVSDDGSGGPSGTGTGEPDGTSDTYLSKNFIAYVLVSHGVNGDGAYLREGGQRQTTAPANAQESENRNGDLVFVSHAKSMAQDNNYFDDTVMWKTNSQLVSQLGNNSCARPN